MHEIRSLIAVFLGKTQETLYNKRDRKGKVRSLAKVVKWVVEFI